MANNCLLTKLKGTVNNSNLPIYNAVKVRLFNTSGLVNTNSVLGINGYNDSVKIKVVEGSVNVYHENTDFVPVATGVTGDYTDTTQVYIQGNATVWVYGKSGFMGLGFNNNAQRVFNDDYFQVDFDTMNYTGILSLFLYTTDTPVGTLKINTIQSIDNLYAILKGGNYCFDFTGCTKENFHIASNFYFGNGGLESSINNVVKNLNIEILENINFSELNIPFQTSVYGDINTLCDALYAKGKTSGTLTFQLGGTQCTYNGDVITVDYCLAHGWEILVTFSQNGWTGVVR